MVRHKNLRDFDEFSVYTLTKTAKTAVPIRRVPPEDSSKSGLQYVGVAKEKKSSKSDRGLFRDCQRRPRKVRFKSVRKNAGQAVLLRDHSIKGRTEDAGAVVSVAASHSSAYRERFPLSEKKSAPPAV